MKNPLSLAKHVKTLDRYEAMEMESILDGFLYKTELMMLYGASGSGKSLFTFGACCAYANPDIGTFLGTDVGTGKVLYVDGEMHANTIVSRREAFQASGLENLHYLAMTEIVDEGETVDFCRDDQANELVDYVRDNGFDLVVLDSVRVLFSLRDENSVEGWRPVNHVQVRLRSADCGVILIHHANKQSFVEGGTTIFSGSTNAVTVHDRTMGVISLGNGIFQLSPGNKEGRDGNGYGAWCQGLAYKVSMDPLKIFDGVDHEALQANALIQYLTTYEPDEKTNNRIKRGVADIYKTLGWIASDHGYSSEKCWDKIKDYLEGEDELPFIWDEKPHNFKQFLKDGRDLDFWEDEIVDDSKGVRAAL